MNSNSAYTKINWFGLMIKNNHHEAPTPKPINVSSWNKRHIFKSYFIYKKKKKKKYRLIWYGSFSWNYFQKKKHYLDISGLYNWTMKTVTWLPNKLLALFVNSSLQETSSIEISLFKRWVYRIFRLPWHVHLTCGKFEFLYGKWLI